ncbi:MAG: hypothetical protein V1918_03270 [Planctomycetota bacterium]
MSADPPSSWKPVRGAIHIHTAYDDGGGGMEEILAAARTSGVDFLVVSDHFFPHAAEHGWAGWQNGGRVLVVAATEFRTRRKHDILALGPPLRLNTREMETPRALEELSARGAVLFLAHPEGCRQLPFGRVRHPWEDWSLDTYAGLEIWDYMHDWVRSLSLGRLADMCRRPAAYIRGPREEILRRWDEVAAHRKVAGLGGLDIHAKKAPRLVEWLLPWTRGGILPYHQNFAAFSHYALVPESWGREARGGEGTAETGERDTSDILRALAQGHGWVAREELAPGRDFFYALEEKSKPGRALTRPMGTETPYRPGQRLIVRTPERASIRLRMRGAVLAETRGEELVHEPSGAGEYRVEVFLRGEPWIYSNHIYLRTARTE